MLILYSFKPNKIEYKKLSTKKELSYNHVLSYIKGKNYTLYYKCPICGKKVPLIIEGVHHNARDHSIQMNLENLVRQERKELYKFNYVQDSRKCFVMV